MNAKERVMAVINHQKPDRMPCFGANSPVTYEQMEKVGAYWPEGHNEGEAMAKQALAAYTVLGFDAVRVPFCQTFEAVALDCIRKPGKVRELEGFPGIEHPPPYKLDDTPEFPDDFLSRGFIPELLKAVKILKKEVGDEVPIVAGIIGPFTIAGALVDTVPLLKATFKTPEKMRPFLDMAEKAGTALARALIDSGADIISCATMASEPILKGEWLQAGTHVDLVGAFRPDMRESDDELIRKAAVFVDTRAGALVEAGDLTQAMESGAFDPSRVQAEFEELCTGLHRGREQLDDADEQITLFKSVGAAREDLAAAILAHRNISHE